MKHAAGAGASGDSAESDPGSVRFHLGVLAPLPFKLKNKCNRVNALVM